ncbi:MAG: DUF998 domain-containing protein [Euryarchaeota archaeon]
MSANKTLPPTHRTLRQVAGVCGLLGVITATSSLALAILYSPSNFSITQNWLSDLGGTSYIEIMDAVPRPMVSSPTTELLFNSGLVLVGVLGIVFALGLLSAAPSPTYRLGAVCMLLGLAAEAGIGLLPEPLGVIHDVITLVFVIFCAVGMFLMGGSLVVSSVKPLGWFSIALGIIALASSSQYVIWRAAAEIIFSAAISLWIVVFSIRMLRRVAPQNIE